MNKRFSKVLAYTTFFVFIVPIFILIAIRYSQPKDEQFFCTADAKMCPDGSFVGRSGPMCEFAQCPSSSTNKTVFGQKIDLNGVSITPLSLVSDSRCPAGVTCVWAGTVTIKAKLEKEGNADEVILDLGKPTTFANQNITLVNVSPNKNHEVDIKNSDYIFTFEVK